MKRKYWFLFPFSLVYGCILEGRNFLFRLNILKKTKPKVFSIGIGNLQIGGTGKTPHVEYISELFFPSKIAFLSRGYGRKTKGFLMATKKSTPSEIGDEPYQYFYKKSKNVEVYVCEKRVEGYHKIMQSNPPEIILLDDAYQHQYIQPHLNLLLTTFDAPFYEDVMLPVGRMREFSRNAKRANIVIFTKCRKDLTEEEMNTKVQIINLLNPFSKVCFSYFLYDLPKSYSKETFDYTKKCVVISGLGLPYYFNDYCNESFHIIEFFDFPDHHNFTLSDILRIIKKHENVQFITTEKDYVKLNEILDKNMKLKFFYISIKVKFYEEENAKRFFLTSFQNFSKESMKEEV